jgi:hypothetical protein
MFLSEPENNSTTPKPLRIQGSIPDGLGPQIRAAKEKVYHGP